MTTLVLTRDELIELTGYRQTNRQVKWLEQQLRIKPPRRADGLPVVTRAQLEQALDRRGGGSPAQTVGPRWSKIAT